MSGSSSTLNSVHAPHSNYLAQADTAVAPLVAVPSLPLNVRMPSTPSQCTIRLIRQPAIFGSTPMQHLPSTADAACLARIRRMRSTSAAHPLGTAHRTQPHPIDMLISPHGDATRRTASSHGAVPRFVMQLLSHSPTIQVGYSLRAHVRLRRCSRAMWTGTACTA